MPADSPAQNPRMTDPMGALSGLQDALDSGIVHLRECDLYPQMRVLLDEPNGLPRFTYAQVDGTKVEAVALFALTTPIQGVHCFQIGYAVIESMRRKGVGAKVLQQAIVELRHGMSRTPMKEVYLEAIVSTTNEPSNRIAKRLITDTPEPGVDHSSKEPIFRYLRKFQIGA